MSSSSSLDAAAATTSSAPASFSSKTGSAAQASSSRPSPSTISAAPTVASVAMLIVSNVVSSVGIILVNKAIMKTYQFPFVMLLSAMHFIVCYVACWALQKAGSGSGDNNNAASASKISDVPLREVLTCSATQVASIVLMNMSLQLNSVGFYQLLKLLTIPFIVAVQTFFYGKTFSRQVQLCLCVILFGIGVATVTDVELNAAGMIVGGLAVVSTAMGQIFINEKKNKYHLSTMQFLYMTMLPMAIMTFAASFLLEFITFNGRVVSLSAQIITLIAKVTNGSCMLFIAASCVLALGANLSGVSLIGATSPVTFQVIGHGKTILIFVLGLVLFPTVQDTRTLLWNVAGIVVAMCGVVAYGHFTSAKPAPVAAPTSAAAPSK